MRILTTGFHERILASAAGITVSGHWDAQFLYRFDNFPHPFVGELIAKLNRESLSGLLNAEWQKSLETADPKTDPHARLLPSDLPAEKWAARTDRVVPEGD